MKIKYDLDTYYDVSDTAIDPLRTYAVGVMDAAREHDPETAYCWNFCLIEFDGIAPSFCWGGTQADCGTATDGVPSVLVAHPKQIAQTRIAGKH